MTLTATGTRPRPEELRFRTKVDGLLPRVFYSTLEDSASTGEPILGYITQNFANPAELTILYSLTRMTLHRVTI